MLGPVLFIIYINDLPDVCKQFSSIFLFADDAKLYGTIVDDSDSSMLEHSCQLLFDWSDEWCMKLNTEKCKVLSRVKKQEQSDKRELRHFGQES